MTISDFPIAIVMALLPGILATLTIKKLTLSGSWDNFKVGLYTIVYSGLIYSMYFMVRSWLPGGRKFGDGSIDDLIGSLTVMDVLLSSLLSLVIGFAVAAASNHKLLFRVANRLKITKKFGDEDLYYDFMRDEQNSEIYISDLERNMTYHGYVTGYSQSKESKELELCDVDVYSYNKAKLSYSLKGLYLTLGIGDRFLIEVPYPITPVEDATNE